MRATQDSRARRAVHATVNDDTSGAGRVVSFRQGEPDVHAVTLAVTDDTEAAAQVFGAAAHGDRAREIGEGLARSALLAEGQFCTKPGLALVPRSQHGDELVDRLRAVFDAHPGGFLLTGGINDAFQQGVKERLALPGVEQLASGADVSGDGFAARSALLEVTPEGLADAALEECFGPLLLVCRYHDRRQLQELLHRLPPALTATVHTRDGETDFARLASETLADRVGRLVWNGFPTGVAVTWAQHHGGPWPATTNALHTSVGATAICRFLRPLTWQDAPQEVLPAELRDDHAGIPTRVDGCLRFLRVA